MNSDNTNENDKDLAENSSSISSDLIRGHINTIILRTLYDSDKYGYEIINEIEEKSKGQYSLKQPTLYSALKRLESQDFLTSYWGGVSNGGRRKYFQITDKGRKVVEQNLAEWEYSRTVIDSLISERDYDFSNPPPSSSVDFNILKKSTSRIHGGKGGEEAFDADEGESDAEEKDTASAQSEEAQAPAAQSFDRQEEEPEAICEAEGTEDPTAQYRSSASAAETAEQAQTYSQSPAIGEGAAQAAPASPLAQPEQPSLSEEEKQRIHENYKVLIGDDTDATSYYYSHVAQRNREERSTFDSTVFNDGRGEYPPQQAAAPIYASQPPQQQQAEYYGAQPEYPAQQAEERPEPSAENDTADMLYSNRSPAERNYKSLLSRLYDNTVKTPKEETAFAEPAAEEAVPDSAAQAPQPGTNADGNGTAAAAVRTERVHGASPASNIEFYDVEEKAENEGLRITTTNGSRNRTVSKLANSTFDKGKALFVTAVYVFVIALAESIVNLFLQDVLQSHTVYVVVPFVIDFVMLGIFLFLYLRGYGKNTRKSQAKSYISASLIIFVNLVLITCLIAYLISAATDSSLNFLLYAIFPCVYLFNVPLFAILYNYNSNKY